MGPLLDPPGHIPATLQLSPEMCPILQDHYYYVFVGGTHAVVHVLAVHQMSSLLFEVVPKGVKVTLRYAASSQGLAGLDSILALTESSQTTTTQNPAAIDAVFDRHLREVIHQNETLTRENASLRATVAELQGSITSLERKPFPFKLLFLGYALGALTVAIIAIILVARAAKRAGRSVFDFFAVGWLGARGIRAIEDRKSRS